MNKIRMIVFDIDGTLIGSDENFSSETIKVLRECHNKGIITVPASGRSIFGLPEVIKDIVDDGCAIFCNGGYLANPKTKEIYESYPLTKKKVLEIYKRIPYENLNHKLSLFTRFLDDDPNKEAKGTNIYEFVDDIYRAMEHNDETIYKAQVFFRGREHLKPEIMKLFADDHDLSVTSAFPYNVEFNNPLATKGNGLKAAARHYGLQKEEIMAIGDGENDLSLLEEAGLKIAMGNAVSVLKEKADVITDTVYNDGFVKAVREYVL